MYSIKLLKYDLIKQNIRNQINRKKKGIHNTAVL